MGFALLASVAIPTTSVSVKQGTSTPGGSRGLDCTRGVGQFMCVLAESFAVVPARCVQILANRIRQRFNRYNQTPKQVPKVFVMTSVVPESRVGRNA